MPSQTRSPSAITHSTLSPPLRSTEKILIIGDVHGCLVELKEIVAAAESLLDAHEKLRIILVGDLVNKGPFSAEVIQYVRSQEWCCVMGNHDEYIAKFFRDEDWDASKNWIHKLSIEDRQWLLDLPYTISIPQTNSIVVHAGLLPGVPLEAQRLKDMILMRTVSRGEGQAWQAHEVLGEGMAWAEIWSSQSSDECPIVIDGKGTVPHIYFGHDARRGLQRTKHATGLDTGCCYGGCLSACLLVNSGKHSKLIQIHPKTVYKDVSRNKKKIADRSRVLWALGFAVALLGVAHGLK